MPTTTEIHFVDGESLVLDEDLAAVKMTDHGVEVLQQEGEDKVKVLFPWARIQKVTQRGPSVGAIYTY
jgi:hypothetical protein